VSGEEAVDELCLPKPEVGCPRHEVWYRDEEDVVGQAGKSEGGFNEPRKLYLVGLKFCRQRGIHDPMRAFGVLFL
jgi:hypothetical protein